MSNKLALCRRSSLRDRNIGYVFAFVCNLVRTINFRVSLPRTDVPVDIQIRDTQHGRRRRRRRRRRDVATLRERQRDGVKSK